MDFYNTRVKKYGPRAAQDYTIEPEFVYTHKDLVVKGSKLYAFWYNGAWHTNWNLLVKTIDDETFKKVEEFKKGRIDSEISAKYINNHSSGLMMNFNDFIKNIENADVEFNTRIIFSDEEPVREDYSTTQLSYTPKKGKTDAFDEMFEHLYDDAELEKILWFMGAVLTNNMWKLQKFLFLYGGKGSGKGTVIDVFRMLFEGYYDEIDLNKLTSNTEFATAGVKESQILIDDDAELNKIKSDINLLKLTGHDPILVNDKYQTPYPVEFKGLVVAASNQMFSIRDVEAGITRRAVVAEPSTRRHEYGKYKELMSKLRFELPHIAQKAIDIFTEAGEGYFEDYMPFSMLEEANLWYSFMRETGWILGDQVTLKTLSEHWKSFLEDNEYDTGGYKKKAKKEGMLYYREYHEQKRIDGEPLRHVFEGLKTELVYPEDLESKKIYKTTKPTRGEMIKEFGLKEYVSNFDRKAETYPAQYTKKDGTPRAKWDNVKNTLNDIDTKELHYVLVPENHIVIDFDLTDEDGEKSLDVNLNAAKDFPDTYTEVSRSGEGLHMHYIYEGDIGKLANTIDADIEIKVFTGNSSLRRKLTLCNNKPIQTISTGLPEKEETESMYKDVEVIAWNENKMRAAVKGNLNKKYHDSTGPSVDFIEKIFLDAEEAGVKYDLDDMRQDVLAFAASSTNQAKRCMGVVSNIKFSTIEPDDSESIQRTSKSAIVPNEELYFFDVEVFSNLFIVAFKQYNKPEVTKWINPSREQIVSLVEKPLVGFNNRRYDNHILYAALLGEDNLALYRQSQRIIHDKNAGSGMYGGAYELSYTDIYDYSNAGNKKSLGKWEVDLGITYDEFELPWDQPVPEDMWERTAEYCGNDVLATEAVFIATEQDYNSRKILASISGLSMNATSNQHTTAMIFEGDPKWETDKELVYTDLSKDFPGYTHAFAKSEYRGEDPGEGGYVYAEPGVYKNVALLDVEAMHPVSAIAMNAFGKYTKNYEDILDARVAIKHGNYDVARNLYGGKLKPFLEDETSAKELSEGLKTPINSVYGLSSARFDTPFKHPDNIDNIVAKRGALFMIDLKHAIQEEGYSVMHIKTDSVKIPDADQKIIDFVHEFGKRYGYTFDHEATYEKLALVNKSTYVSKDIKTEEWEATGAQFKEPFVFKTLFSEEAVEPEDFFVTKQVQGAAIYMGGNFIGKIATIFASNNGDDVMRITDDKEGFVSGTKGYKWSTSNEFKNMKDLDMVYYNELVAKAVKAVEKVGDPRELFDKTELVDDILPF